MADEVKEKVTATEVKDFDFEKFLAEIGKESELRPRSDGGSQNKQY